MKKLYVGCRVRILWSITYPELAGTEGVIIAKGEFPTRHKITGEWIVRVDAWGSHISPERKSDGAYSRFTPHSDQLAPIIPEGMHPASWADCLWSPESGFRYDKVTA